MDIKSIIKNTLQTNNISATESQIDKLLKYYNLLIEFNKNINLTAITDPYDVSLKHFADSLVNISYYKENSTLCDIGTGAGLPGIPIAIFRPDLQIILVDSLLKRINFLNIVIKELKLNNTKTIHTRAQELPQNGISRETFDYVIARAVAKLNILAEYCLPFVKLKGEMIAFKATSLEEEISTANQAINKLGGKLKEIQTFSLKNTQINELLERKIIIISKTKATPTNYPRLKNKILTSPL